jgi:hypothetical protein
LLGSQFFFFVGDCGSVREITGSIVRRFGVGTDPVSDGFFFFVFVRVMHLCMKPSQFHNFV